MVIHLSKARGEIQVVLSLKSLPSSLKLHYLPVVGIFKVTHQHYKLFEEKSYTFFP